MEVKFLPSDNERGSGSTSFASWQNPDLKAARAMLFHCRSNERIESIEVDQHGITARLVTTSPSEQAKQGSPE